MCCRWRQLSSDGAWFDLIGQSHLVDSRHPRTTRHADVAFWLHILAALLIVHPLFNLLDSFETVMGLSLVFAIYILLTIASLILDRRALMVAALGYALYAPQRCLPMLAMMIWPMRLAVTRGRFVDAVCFMGSCTPANCAAIACRGGCEITTCLMPSG